MRIKRLEITGFKSFCDRTVVRFDDPITGVVGPNGCGKSNVVDAIRWCMVNSRPSTCAARRCRMSSFSGSDKRGPLGFCEVSLTFENDGRIPVEYLQFTEVTVTRRLFRDGTSEYYINKTPLPSARHHRAVPRHWHWHPRLLDHRAGPGQHDHLRQTGGAPLSIEEAAGITKYKAAQKPRSRSSIRPGRICCGSPMSLPSRKDSLAASNGRPTKPSGTKRYRAELRDIELWGMSQRWFGLTLEAKCFRLGGAVGRSALQVEAARQTIEAELAAGRLTLVEEETRLQQLQEELYVLDNRVKLSEAENEHARREETRLSGAGTQAAGEQESLYERANQAAQELQSCSKTARR